MSIICTYWIIMFNYRPRWAFSNNLLYYPSLYGCLYISIHIFMSVSVPCFHARILNCNLPFTCPFCSPPHPLLPWYFTKLWRMSAIIFAGVNNYKYYYRFVRLAILLQYYYCHSKSSQIINNKCIQISRIEIGLYTSNWTTTTTRYSHMFCSTEGKVFRF